MDTRLDGKRAAVTAGAGGVGSVIASRLAAEGAEVFVCDIDEGAIAALPENINGARIDVADPEQVDLWLRPLVRNGIDILINNAGISGPTAQLASVPEIMVSYLAHILRHLCIDDPRSGP